LILDWLDARWGRSGAVRKQIYTNLPCWKFMHLWALLEP
jgi:hypothetical protein